MAGISEPTAGRGIAPANPFTASHVASILRERGWQGDDATPQVKEWMQDAARLLGPHAVSGAESAAPDEAKLADLLELIFSYDARAIAEDPENQAVVTREGAREVIRELANLLLGGFEEIDSVRFGELIHALKQSLGFSGRGLFYPLRLALAGRAGEGELDRVILLLDRAARLDFSAPVKGTRQRVIEFCAAFG